MSTAKKFAGQTAIYGVGSILTRSLSFLLTPIVLIVLSVKAYGVFTGLYAYASMLNAVLAFGMETTFFRYLNKHPGKEDIVYSNSFLAIAGMAFSFFLLTFSFTHGIAEWVRTGTSESVADYVLYVRFFITILIIDALCVIPFAKLRADGRPVRYALINLLSIVVFVCSSIFFLFVVPYFIANHLPGSVWMQGWYRTHWVGYIFISNICASSLSFIMLLPQIFKLKFKFSMPLLKNMLWYSMPIFVANMSYIINENLDKQMLGKLLPQNISDQQLGIYGACCKIAIFLNIFIQAFRLGAEPFFFNHAKNKNSGQTYARIMDYFVITVCIIFIALVANIEILKYFIGTNPKQRVIFWTGLPVVPILLFGYVSLGIYMNLSVWYKLSDQTKYGLYISGIGAIITIVLNYIFIPKYSYMASAWTSLIAYATMMALSYLWGQRNYPIPYNIKKNLAYIVASLVMVYLSFNVFNKNIFVGNAFLLLFAGTAFYFERANLRAIFKR